MATLFLHIGTSKAGSTALQEFLSHNRRTLADRGLEYGPAFRSANHLELAAAFCTRSTRVTRDLGVHNQADRRRLQRTLARRFEDQVEEDARWLVSSEHLGTLLTRAEDLDALGTFLRRRFERVVVLVILRRAGCWLPSAYVESIRGGSTKLLDAEYVEQRRRLLDHRRLLRRWQDGLRPDQIGVLPFLESDKSDPGALSFRVLVALGLDRPDRLEWSSPPRLANESMSAYATEVLRLANPHLRKDPLRPLASRQRAISVVTSTWPGPALALTPEAARQVRLLDLDDVTMATSKYAIGPGWAEWAAAPMPPVQPQISLTSAERAQALDVLRRKGVVATTGASAAGRRWAAPLRRAWQRWRHR